jgi:cytochrome c
MDHIKTRTLAIIAATLAAMTVNTAAMADSQMMSPGLMMPQMDPENGRALFASKGCVVCHSVNGIGGEDARMLGAEFMEGPMNPFEFAARM